MVFVGVALLLFLSFLLAFIITENIMLTYTTHQIHLTKSNDHTSYSLGDTSPIRAHDP